LWVLSDGVPSFDRRQYSVSLVWDIGVTSTIITGWGSGGGQPIMYATDWIAFINTYANL
jgi:hypothetical protein